MRKPEPIDIILIGVPVLCEAAAVCLFIAAAFLWIVIGSHGMPV